MNILPIRDEPAYEKALAEVKRLWGAQAGTKEADRLDVLLVLVEDYEEKHHPIEAPDPIGALLLRMDQMDMTRADLGALLGIGSGRVSEILNRQRRLTIDMIRKIAAEMAIPPDVLIQPYELSPVSPEPATKVRSMKPARRRNVAA